LGEVETVLVAPKKLTKTFEWLVLGMVIFGSCAILVLIQAAQALLAVGPMTTTAGILA